MSEPLQNIEAEQSLLGALLYRNEVLAVGCDGLRPEHFYEAVHARIYEAAAAMIRAGQTANAITLKTAFERDETLKEIGGTAYLARLMGAAGTIVNAPSYAKTIRDLALRRSVMRLAEDALAEVPSLAIDQSAHQFVAELAAKLTALSEGGGARRTVSGYEARRSSLDKAAELYRTGQPRGVASGLATLDKLIGGFVPNSLVIVGARPSMGKSLFGLAVADNCARRGRPVLFCTFEMSADELGDRLNARSSGIPYFKIANARFDEAQYRDLVERQERARNDPLIIEDMAGGSMADVQAAIARAATRHPDLALVVIDYANLIAPGDRYRGNKVNEVGEITAALKACANRHHIAILALVQLNRSVEAREDKHPNLADLRDSGSIEQDADVVLLLYRESYYLERERASVASGSNEEADLVARLAACQGMLEINVAKNRQGPAGIAKVFVNLATNGISDERLWG